MRHTTGSERTAVSDRIVQYVGFDTAVGRDEFLLRWAPFARRFSSLGARSIDLYEVSPLSEVRYISRNVWDRETYLATFPSGIAGGGGGDGITVVQFGGYWREAAEGTAPDRMKLAFLPSRLERADPSSTVRLRCTEGVPYPMMLDILPQEEPALPAGSLLLSCFHIKRV